MTGTIITALVLLAAVAAIIAKLIRDKRGGQCPGCGCGKVCPSSSSCRAKK